MQFQNVIFQIQISQRFNNIYKTLTMQNIIWSLLHNCERNMNKWNKITLCMLKYKWIDIVWAFVE
jgi:hypothetical protein